MVISRYHLKGICIIRNSVSLPLTSNWYFWICQYRQCGRLPESYLTTPLKVYDLVNTAEMVLHQMERMAKSQKTETAQ